MKKFFCKVEKAINGSMGAFVFFILSAYAFFFFKNSSFAYGWMIQLYPFGDKFPLVFKCIIGVVGALQIAYILIRAFDKNKKISDKKTMKIIHIVLAVLSVALFVYTFVVLFHLDHGFVREDILAGLGYFKTDLLLFGLTVFIILPFAFLENTNRKTAKCIAMVMVCALLVLPMNFVDIATNIQTNVNFEPVDFKTENLLDGAKIVDETLRKNEKPDGENLLKDDNTVWTAQSAVDSPKENQLSSNNAYVEIKLKKSSTFNTCVIEEVGNNAQYFRLQALVDGKWVNIYRAEKIQAMRVCSFDSVTTDTIRLSVDKFREENTPAKIKSIKLYNEPKQENKDFEVTTYKRLDSDRPTEILKKGEDYVKRYAKFYDVYTSVIIFDCVHWDENGNADFGEQGEEAFAKEIDALKEIIEHRENKEHKVKLILTGLANGVADGFGGVNGYMAQYHEKIADQIVDIVTKYDFAGTDIDWEYPNNDEDWANFDKFIQRIDDGFKKNGGERIISTALSAYMPRMSEKTYDIIDQIQFMAYDGNDMDGYQSSLEQAQQGVAEFVKYGADKSKINIGIGIYARPLNSTPYWAIWRDFPNADYYNSMYYNIIDGNQVYDGTFCSPAVAADKTAYALFSGCGGVMTFRVDTDKFMDDENSVTGGIYDALNRYVVKF